MGLALGRRRGQLTAGGVRATADRSGDVESFTSWVRPHLVAMSRLAARLSPRGDGDDVVQEALTAAWRKWHSYDPARGSAQSWLLAVVADQAGKARRRIRPVVDLVDGAHRDHHADVDLERAIAALAARQRLAVALYYFLDLPVAEVAVVMSCSAGTVKATLSQARLRLRRSLGEDLS